MSGEEPTLTNLVLKGGAFLILTFVFIRQLMKMPKAIMITMLIIFGTTMVVITLLMIYQYDMMQAFAVRWNLAGGDSDGPL